MENLSRCKIILQIYFYDHVCFGAVCMMSGQAFVALGCNLNVDGACARDKCTCGIFALQTKRFEMFTAAILRAYSVDGNVR